jgi:hypothetical protein
MWEEEYKIEQDKKRSFMRLHYNDILDEMDNSQFKKQKSNTVLATNTIIEREEDCCEFDNKGHNEDYESTHFDMNETNYNYEDSGSVDMKIQNQNNYCIWNNSDIIISYSNDNFQSMNEKYKSFNIGKEIKILLDKIINFNKPHDSSESIHDYSELTIGDFMILHRKMILNNNMTEVEGQDIMNLIKKTLPVGCKLFNKDSKDAQLYISPPNVLKYDICHRKGCNVYVGSQNKAFECSTCKSVRFRHCTNKICMENKNCITCHHIRPSLKQVLLFYLNSFLITYFNKL